MRIVVHNFYITKGETEDETRSRIELEWPPGRPPVGGPLWGLPLATRLHPDCAGSVEVL